MEKYCNGGDTKSIPLAAHESAMARAERTTRRLCALILTLILLLFASNLAWVLYESSFEDETQIVTQDADNGENNFVGGDIIGETNGNN